MAPRPPIPPAVALNLALAVVASSNTPLLLLDDGLIVIAASASFCRVFDLEPAHVEGCALMKLGAGEWNVPQLGSLLKATASGFAEVQNYEMELSRSGQDKRCLVLNATKLAYADDNNVRLILAITDITDVRTAEKLKESLAREKQLLLRELNHRVANSLQIIASVLMQSARKVQSEETRSHLFDAHQRVMSVASLQHQLAGSRLGDVEMRPYLTTLCDSISASMIRDRGEISLEVRADESTATADESVSVGLIVTELVINGLKHAFPGNRTGNILVEYKAQAANWTLSVTDDGVGMSTEPSSSKPGLGTSIIQALSGQLKAVISVVDIHPGTKVSVMHTCVPALVKQAAGAAKAV
jgi:two-component system, sensor histidine kinase PdtaS